MTVPRILAPSLPAVGSRSDGCAPAGPILPPVSSARSGG
jgi:hypothetical protein